MLEAYGAYGEKTLYGKKVQGVIRSTFVVDADGTIEQALYNVKATGHVAALRKKLSVEGGPSGPAADRRTGDYGKPVGWGEAGVA